MERIARTRGYVLIAPDGKVQDIWTGYTKGRLKKKLKENLK